jgi:hypothetical protein
VEISRNLQNPIDDLGDDLSETDPVTRLQAVERAGYRPGRPVKG